jgi:hypothetical protein
MRCASSAAVVDELLRRFDKVDEVNAHSSTRRAVYFLRVVRAHEPLMKRDRREFALIPLRRKAFASKHMSRATLRAQRASEENFSEM